MAQPLGYYIPPFQSTDWRIVNAYAGAGRVRIVWYPPETLATDWDLSVISATVARPGPAAADFADAEDLGLLPELTDGRSTAYVAHDSATEKLFVCECRDDYARSDQDVAVRLHAEPGLLMGIACCLRPPLSRGDALGALKVLGAARVLAMKAAGPRNPADDDQSGPMIGPYLRDLDEAMERDDRSRASEIIGALRPFLYAAPLSIFALNIHITEGWAFKREAFEGNADAAGRAIDTLRRTLDCFDDRAQPGLYRMAALWLAQAYSKRDGPGDLARAIQGYQTVVRLTDAKQLPRDLAAWRLQTAALHRELGKRSGGAAATEGLRHANLAMEELAAADELSRGEGDVAGVIEVAIARADAARLLGMSGASAFYQEAWRLLTKGDGQAALGPTRWKELANQVAACMRELDRKEFGFSEPVEKARATAFLLRPLAATRKILLRPPDGSRPLSFEAALLRALAPAVPLSYFGGGVHPAGGSLLAAASEKGHDHWRKAIAILLPKEDIIFFIPGDSAGVQWELSYLIGHALAPKCVFVMLPEAADSWQSARTAAALEGLLLPPYSPRGAFVRFAGLAGPPREIPFDSLWNPGALLEALEDLFPAHKAERESDTTMPAPT